MPEVHVKESITIKRKAGDIYGFWRHFENLPRFIDHLDSVEDLGGGRSRWTIKTPVGDLGWESEIVRDEENEVIEWHSLPGSRVQNRGALSLAEKEGGATEVTVELSYKPPGKYNSFLEDTVLDVVTGEQMKEDLKNLKRMMESGTP
ncbi:MAG: SRPBCC family protein [Nitrospirota bacterium]|jgi:uncharacterized membrane protein